MSSYEEDLVDSVAEALRLLPPLHRMTLERLYGLNGKEPESSLPIISSYLTDDQDLLEAIASDALRMLRRRSFQSVRVSERLQ
jgi:hypothetical protein